MKSLFCVVLAVAAVSAALAQRVRFAWRSPDSPDHVTISDIGEPKVLSTSMTGLFRGAKVFRQWNGMALRSATAIDMSLVDHGFDGDLLLVEVSADAPSGFLYVAASCKGKPTFTAEAPIALSVAPYLDPATGNIVAYRFDPEKKLIEVSSAEANRKAKAPAHRKLKKRRLKKPVRPVHRRKPVRRRPLRRKRAAPPTGAAQAATLLFDFGPARLDRLPGFGGKLLVGEVDRLARVHRLELSKKAANVA